MITPSAPPSHLESRSNAASHRLPLPLVLIPLLAALWTASPSQACTSPGLVGYWPLAGDGIDTSGCDNDGVVSGAGATAGYDGGPNGALRFDGVDDRVDVGSSASLKPALPLSLSMLVKHDCSSACFLFSNNANAAVYAGFTLQIRPSGVLEARYGDGGVPGPSNRRSATTTTELEPETWYHVAVVVRGPTDFEIFLDGASDPLTTSGSGAGLVNLTDPVLIGSDDGAPPFKGSLAEVYLFDRDLDASEIAGLDPRNLPIAEVYHSPADDGVPGPSPFAFAGTTTLNLWLETGSTPTSSFLPNPVVACQNGPGDELCGLHLRLATTGGLQVGSFAPASGVTGRVDDDDLGVQIARANGQGDLGRIRLGQLVVWASAEGAVLLTSQSQLVNARLALAGMPESTIATPEPAMLPALALGIALLSFLAARRRSQAAQLVLLVGLMASGEASAQIYASPKAFENAVGSGVVQTEDFESIPLDGNGFAAFDNGHDFGGFSYTSLTLASPITLETLLGIPTGLTGTALIEAFFGSAPIVLSPGGAIPFGGSGPANDDDFRLTWPVPVRGAAVSLIGVAGGLADTVEFRDALDQTIASATVATEGGYVGYVSLPPAPPIASVVVLDDEDDNEVYLDQVQWAESVGFEPVEGFALAPRLQDWRPFGADTPELANAFGGGLDIGDEFGFAIAAIGDLNGDGVPDAAVGAPNANPGAGTNGADGAVFILFLERNGGIRSVQRIDDTSGELSGQNDPGGVLPGASFGIEVAGLGDLDGDGIREIAVGDSDDTAIYILFMRRDGTVRQFHKIGNDEGAVGGGGLGDLEEIDDLFGLSIAWLGDLNGDGKPEIAAGAPTQDSGGSNIGSVYILSLEPDGTFTLLNKLTAIDSAFLDRVPIVSGDFFGYSLAALDDLDGDGVTDLAVAATGDDDTANQAGAVWILLLNPDGTVKSAIKEVHPGAFAFGNCLWGAGDSVTDRFGSSLAWIPTPDSAARGLLAVGVSRFDAIDPCVVSGAFYGQGAVAFLALEADGAGGVAGSIFRTDSSSGLIGAGAFEPPLGEETRLGAGLAYLGDLDEDGFPDILAGANLADTAGQANAGAAYLLSIGGTSASAFADELVSFSGTSRIVNILGPPGKSGALITQNGSATVQFVDNFGRLSGDSDPDLRVHVVGVPSPTSPDTNTIRIDVSENGSSFFTGPSVSLGIGDPFVDVDLDGFVPFGTEIRFARLTTLVGCTPPPFIPQACLTIFEPVYNAVELLANADVTADVDFDGIADVFDNCRSIANASQQDSDADGWGDRCDVCPDDPNPTQAFICSNWKIELEGPFDTGSSTEAAWDIYLRGGSDPLGNVNFGLIAPADTDVETVQYVLDRSASGGSCDRPPSSQLGNSIPGGAGCPAALDLDSRISTSLSGVLRPSQSNGFAGRNDTLYTFLEASNPSIGFAEPDERVFAGSAITTYLAPALPSARDSLYFDFFVSELPPPTEGAYEGDSNTSGDGDPIINVQVSPAAGEPDGAALRWEVCLNADRQINRLSLAVQWPLSPIDLVDVSQMTLEGCETLANPGSPAPDYARLCSAGVSARVDAASSLTWGPSPTASSAPLLRIQLEGALEGTNSLVVGGLPGPSIGVLNTATGVDDYSCVGVVDFTANPILAPLLEGRVPTIVIDGLDQAPFPQPPVRVGEDEDADATPDALGAALNEVGGTSQQTTASDDADGDGLRDEEDNCRFVANDGTNSGGLLAANGGLDPFGRGDACECGDTNQSNAMLGGSDDDVDLILDYLVGSASDPSVEQRCSVSRGAGCDILDAAILAAGIESRDVVLEPVCSAFLP